MHLEKGAPCGYRSCRTRAKRPVVALLDAGHFFADRFLTHMLTRNIRIEEDLIDQLFNSTEKRLARTPPKWLERRARASTSS